MGPTLSPVSGLIMRVSVLGTVSPTAPALASSGGVRWEAGLNSVIPYPCVTMQPSREAHAAPTSSGSGAAAEKRTCTEDRSA